LRAAIRGEGLLEVVLLLHRAPLCLRPRGAAGAARAPCCGSRGAGSSCAQVLLAPASCKSSRPCALVGRPSFLRALLGGVTFDRGTSEGGDDVHAAVDVALQDFACSSGCFVGGGRCICHACQASRHFVSALPPSTAPPSSVRSATATCLWHGLVEQAVRLPEVNGLPTFRCAAGGCILGRMVPAVAGSLRWA
jgi:hypothetical protein